MSETLQELIDSAEASGDWSAVADWCDSLRAEIRRVRADEDFTARARRLIERDRELLDRLAQ